MTTMQFYFSKALQHEPCAVRGQEFPVIKGAWVQGYGLWRGLGYGCVAALAACSASAGSVDLQQPDLSLLPALKPPQYSAAPAEQGGMFLREFRLQGATLLSVQEVQKAVYPYLGPGRTAADVEAAREALQQLYHSKGYQTVTVQVPQQKVRRGVVVLSVDEVKVGRVRVRGARYHEPEQILAKAPSMREGTVPNFNDVVRDITALNNTADRRVTPELMPGQEPGTLDVDLVVEDSLPLHGSLELNNRNSSSTTALRLNGSLSYDNLWQIGHSAGASFQIAPGDLDEVQVYSGFYRARFEGLEKLSLTLSATRQDTNISTLGGAVSVGNGYTFSLSGSYMLPGTQSYYNSLTFGVDYRHANQNVQVGSSTITTPINYIPVQLGYSGGWRGQSNAVDIYIGSTVHFRGAGSSGWEEWQNSRRGADGNFVVLRADVGYTAQLGEGFESYLRLHGQLSDTALISQEQVGGGGMDSVRGYYEGEITSDQGLFGTAELRTGPLPVQFAHAFDNDSLRLYAFADAGLLNRRNAEKDEKKNEYLASFGAGVRFGIFKYFSGVVNLGVPVIDGRETKAWHPRATFIIRGEF